jgi:hypothetical protein
VIGLVTGSGAVDKGDGEEEKSGAIVLLNAETLVRNLVGCLVSRGCFFGLCCGREYFIVDEFFERF